MSELEYTAFASKVDSRSYTYTKYATNADVALIEAVKSRPILWSATWSKYNKSHNKSHRDLLWEEVATELDLQIESARIRWKSIRDSYTRCKRANKKYNYGPHLRFLDEDGENTNDSSDDESVPATKTAAVSKSPLPVGGTLVVEGAAKKVSKRRKVAKRPSSPEFVEFEREDPQIEFVFADYLDQPCPTPESKPLIDQYPAEEKLDLSIIAAVASRTPIWDSRELTYTNSAYKRTLWDEIQEELGEPCDKLRTRWKSIRDAYTRSKTKRNNGAAVTSSSGYRYSKHMTFIDPIIEYSGTDDLANDDSPDKDDPCNTLDSKELLSTLARVLQEAVPVQSPHDSFCSFLKTELDKLSPRQARVAKQFFMNYIFDLQKQVE